jgi:hypothetical protein
MTADVNITYTASVAAVASTTPAARRGSKASIDTAYLDSRFRVEASGVGT